MISSRSPPDVTLTTINNITDGPNGLSSVRSTITLNGNGHTLARSSVTGTPKFRLLHVGTEGHLSLNGTTLQNGDVIAVEAATYSGPYYGGGGLFNLGSTSLAHCIISGNEAGGGGGIDNRGTLTVTNSTISDNRSPVVLGGGLANSGSATPQPQPGQSRYVVPPKSRRSR